MEVVGPEQAEQLIARCRLTDAAAGLAAGDRLRAAALALAGDDQSLAAVAAPELLACRSAAAVVSYLDALGATPQSTDYLCAAVVLSWTPDSSAAVFDLFREAHDRAIEEKRFHFAVGARERLAHHAILFGELEVGRIAADEAMRIAGAHRLFKWYLRAAATAARLALDSGEIERAVQLVARSRPHVRSADELALLSSVGAAAAVTSADEAALREWNSPEILDVALHSASRESSIAATIALLAPTEATPDSPVSIALRRSLLASQGTTGAIELFSLAARHGDLEEARLAADALNAFVAPNRKYLKAHALLARAYVLFRCGERSGGIDHAGDAARAFNAIGMRRWMNEAMLLLVRQDDENFPRRRRGRPLGSALTSREQQVAHLIRRGARNREVAAALQISEHTVERHVSSILGRLGLRSRWQIVDPKNASEH
ncbi:MAG TPA: LuxR C-terminal-related transcriptional regulator [Candidatus Cybelea sp.]|jgi:DNA-binding CsgD family transcriptional regulator